LSKTSFNRIAHALTPDYPIYRWVVEAGANQAKKKHTEDIKEIGFDEMYQFIETKNKLRPKKPLP
jgi:hypothetical protein